MTFALVFFWMNRVCPGVRGVRSTALGFAFGVPCTLLLMLRGDISASVSILIGNLMALLAYSLIYNGVMRFVDGKSRLRLVCVSAAVSLGVVAYYSEVRDDVVPRIVAMTVFSAMLQGMAAYELLKRSRTSVSRGTMLFLGSFMGLYAAFTLERMVETVLRGAPSNYQAANAMQTSTMVATILFLCASGFCFLLMTSNEMITRSREAMELDALSGAFNRRGIEARLTLELARSMRHEQKLSIALVDVDYFKEINDTLGHTRGNAAIREIAAAISKRLRNCDYLGRYGGDEFLVVLPQTSNVEATLVMERLRRATGDLDLPGTPHQLTLSVGVTEAGPEDDVMTLIARADEALYQAKHAGRDCQQTLMPEVTFSGVLGIRGNAERRAAIKKQVRAALHADRGAELAAELGTGMGAGMEGRLGHEDSRTDVA
ncbi:GGDEF domain-containing protein [Acidicapsa ligni]|uniref:GGDEF domain-containing protein n=1 Tax=Acidicapsa ligni TaxID=542300 RepID=UPI0021DF8A5B|nr:GGDEF domain-containing protein [Acidicapsa ligni]